MTTGDTAGVTDAPSPRFLRMCADATDDTARHARFTWPDSMLGIPMDDRLMMQHPQARC